ncbi:lipase chaperone, partial [Paracidovorax cattleyae]
MAAARGRMAAALLAAAVPGLAGWWAQRSTADGADGASARAASVAA